MRECDPVRTSGRPSEDHPLVIEARIRAAVSAATCGDPARLLEELAALSCTSPYERALVDDRMSRIQQSAVADLWRRGWQPADVHRIVVRRSGARHGLVAARAIVEESRAYSKASIDRRWLGQLDELELALAEGKREDISRLDELERDITVVCGLLGLPALPRLCPLPGEANISRPGRPDAKGGPAAGAAVAPSAIRIGLENPYASAKSTLIGSVANANRCSAVISESLGFATVFGFEADLEATEMLYTSLLVQATAAMAPAERRAGGSADGRKRAFRHSFLVGYSSRIGERLREAAQAAEGEALREHGGTLLPVLAGRKAAVEDAKASAYPNLRTQRTSVSHGTAYYAGRAVADIASLSTSSPLRRSAERSA